VGVGAAVVAVATGARAAPRAAGTPSSSMLAAVGDGRGVVALLVGRGAVGGAEVGVERDSVTVGEGVVMLRLSSAGRGVAVGEGVGLGSAVSSKVTASK
jgi:hypothetical protein